MKLFDGNLPSVDILIESQWNLNKFAQMGLSASDMILIESQWNLNKLVAGENKIRWDINRITVEFK